MNCIEAMDRLGDLKTLRKIYKRLVADLYSSMFSNTELQHLIVKTDAEIFRIVELMHNMELKDSYDPNTGETNSIYREVTEKETLLRLCGGPRNEQD